MKIIMLVILASFCLDLWYLVSNYDDSTIFSAPNWQGHFVFLFTSGILLGFYATADSSGRVRF